MIGAGAGPFHKVGNNCELMPNILMHKNGDHFEVANNNTYYADVCILQYCFIVFKFCYKKKTYCFLFIFIFFLFFFLDF